GEGKVQLPLHQPTHVQPPRGGVDLRNRGVPAHVERVRGGHRTLGQGGGPGLSVERLVLVHHQVRALSIATHATSLRGNVWFRPISRVPCPHGARFHSSGAR